jgi:hypothetical protein
MYCSGSCKKEKEAVSIRQIALSWWRLLHIDKKQYCLDKYKPNWTMEMINTSSSTIEYIYKQEHNL